MMQGADFTKGTLLYFEPFYFPDGRMPANKFFLVLHNDDDTLLLVSLPTSRDHVPGDVDMKSGCIELPERNFNAFVFIAGEQVTRDFSFEKNTFVYGGGIHEYDVKAVMKPLDCGKSKVKVIGALLPDVFESLVECLRSSDIVRRKYKRML